MAATRALVCVFVCLAAGALACGAPRSLPRGATPIWRDYTEMPNERALAIASDGGDVWVAGASGGHATRLDALEAAMAECEQRRQALQLSAPCHLFAVGDRRILVD